MASIGADLSDGGVNRYTLKSVHVTSLRPGQDGVDVDDRPSRPVEFEHVEAMQLFIASMSLELVQRQSQPLDAEQDEPLYVRMQSFHWNTNQHGNPLLSRRSLLTPHAGAQAAKAGMKRRVPMDRA